jgi:hypothetical protein
MNIYLDTLTSDINRVYEQSHVCRGEWCRALESEMDALQYELTELRANETLQQEIRFDEMLEKLRNAYRHVAPDIHMADKR